MKAQMHNFSTWIKETDPDVLDDYFTDLLTAAGFNVLKGCSHRFTPQGFTILYLLSESHLAIHTFPEEGSTYVELSSCVEEPFSRFLRALYNDPHGARG